MLIDEFCSNQHRHEIIELSVVCSRMERLCFELCHVG